MYSGVYNIDTDNNILRNYLVTFIGENNRIQVTQDKANSFFEVIADFIIHNVDDKKIRRILSKHYGDFNIGELKQNTDNRIKDYYNRKHEIKRLLAEYFKESPTVNIDGFIRFRLKDYDQMLENVVSDITEDFITNKEYENFIHLVKTLICAQEAYVKHLQIIVTPDKKYSVLDDELNDITATCITEFLEEFNFKFLNKDDFLFSTIINLTPDFITIHNERRIGNREIINTLRNIYEDNLILCDSCDICKNR